MAGILRDEKKHGSGDGLSVLEGEAGKGAVGFRGVNDEVDGLTGGDIDGVAGDGGAGGFEGADAKAALRGEFHFVGAYGKRRPGKREFSLGGNCHAIGFAGLDGAKSERRI